MRADKRLAPGRRRAARCASARTSGGGDGLDGSGVAARGVRAAAAADAARRRRAGAGRVPRRLLRGSRSATPGGARPSRSATRWRGSSAPSALEARLDPALEGAVAVVIRRSVASVPQAVGDGSALRLRDRPAGRHAAARRAHLVRSRMAAAGGRAARTRGAPAPPARLREPGWRGLRGAAAARGPRRHRLRALGDSASVAAGRDVCALPVLVARDAIARGDRATRSATGRPPASSRVCRSGCRTR